MLGTGFLDSSDSDKRVCVAVDGLCKVNVGDLVDFLQSFSYVVLSMAAKPARFSGNDPTAACQQTRQLALSVKVETVSLC